MSSLMRNKKRSIRGAVLAKREALPSLPVRDWGESIQRRALNLSVYRAARSIALYSPLGNEVATSAIQRDALRARKRLHYPGMVDGSEGMFRIRSEGDLVPGRYGSLEPSGSQRFLPRGREGAVVFVPGIAFDCNGNRLGRGTGWYDKFLSSLDRDVSRVALAYEFQILEIVPVESGDSPVHVIVTERRVINCPYMVWNDHSVQRFDPCRGFNVSRR